ncbi:MAG: hypothetical protein OXI96_01210 [Acidimicrobiaceae bacterium]|nr:hypothetical protein [Acidimicrobiaceae bacterium]
MAIPTELTVQERTTTTLTDSNLPSDTTELTVQERTTTTPTEATTPTATGSTVRPIVGPVGMF